MEYLIDIMKPEDWRQVRSIYLEGIATGRRPWGQFLIVDNAPRFLKKK